MTPCCPSCAQVPGRPAGPPLPRLVRVPRRGRARASAHRARARAPARHVASRRGVPRRLVRLTCPLLPVTVPSLSATVRYCPLLSVTARYCPLLSAAVCAIGGRRDRHRRVDVIITAAHSALDPRRALLGARLIWCIVCVPQVAGAHRVGGGGTRQTHPHPVHSTRRALAPGPVPVHC